MAKVEIRMTAEQNEGTESFLANWLKTTGDRVAVDEPLAEISTDKVVYELATPQAGIVREIRKQAGDPVTAGEILAVLETEPAAPPPSEPAHGLSPAVRRLLAEHALEPAAITATGRDGRLSVRDVEGFLESRVQATGLRSRLVPHSAMRRAIAANMAKSLHSAPHVTALVEVDLSRVQSDRAARKSVSEAPTLTAYLIYASARAIQTVPFANSRWHEDHVEVFEEINIGFGAATPDDSLVVPVVRAAARLDLEQIGAAVKELTRKARENQLTRDDVAGGTFTLSNYGVGGSILAAPIVLNQGQAAILGAGKMEKRLRVNPLTEEIDVKPMMYVSLTIDHRVLDGKQTNAFLARFARVIEEEI